MTTEKKRKENSERNEKRKLNKNRMLTMYTYNCDLI